MTSICIVGNGGSSLNENGKFIDKCDVVIRIKNFKITGYEKYVGSKTNIWCTKWFSFEENEEKNNLDYNYTKIWLPILNPLQIINNEDLKLINECMFSNLFKNKNLNLDLHINLLKIINNNVEFIEEKELDFCLKQLNIDNNLFYTKSGVNIVHPTTYLFCILLCMQRFHDSVIYITGFDGFSKGYYWNQNETKKHNKTWPHYYEREVLYIKKLIYSNKVILI